MAQQIAEDIDSHFAAGEQLLASSNVSFSIAIAGASVSFLDTPILCDHSFRKSTCELLGVHHGYYFGPP
jgi:hypothetical protein